MTNETYVISGLLVHTENGEGAKLLGIVNDEYYSTILAENLPSTEKNQYWTVRYWISEKPLSKDELDYELAAIASGYADVNYELNYSEITGYLWTDEDFNVGGHDLIAELSMYIGKYLYLEIETSDKPFPDVG